MTFTYKQIDELNVLFEGKVTGKKWSAALEYNSFNFVDKEYYLVILSPEIIATYHLFQCTNEEEVISLIEKEPYFNALFLKEGIENFALIQVFRSAPENEIFQFVNISPTFAGLDDLLINNGHEKGVVKYQ